MGYAVSDSIVRANRFKPSGKWYDTIALEMNDFWDTPSIFDAVRGAMQRKGVMLEKDWLLIVLEPYHRYSHPVIIKGK